MIDQREDDVARVAAEFVVADPFALYRGSHRRTPHGQLHLRRAGFPEDERSAVAALQELTAHRIDRIDMRDEFRVAALGVFESLAHDEGHIGVLHRDVGQFPRP